MSVSVLFIMQSLHCHVRTLYRPQTNKDKANDKSTSTDKDASKRSRRDAARLTTSSSSPPASTAATAPSPSSSPMEDTPSTADSQQRTHAILYITVDSSETASQLKQRILSHVFTTTVPALPTTPPQPPSTVSHTASLYYRGCLLRDAELLVQQVQEKGDVYLTAVLTDKPIQPSQSISSNSSSSSSSSSPSTSASSPAAAVSASAGASSSLPSSGSSSSRRAAPPPEQILTDLNRLITSDILNPLLDMGFTRPRAIKALIQNLLNPELAIAWLLEHTDDADIDDPLTPHQLHTIARAFHLIPSPDIDQCIRSGRCTYTVTAERYAAQQYYQCRTCELVGGRGCCVSCARLCHAGHVVEGPIPSESFFCDCGAGVGGVVCRALTGGNESAAGGDGTSGATGGEGGNEEDGMEVEGAKKKEEEARRIKAEEEERSRFVVRVSQPANHTATISDLNPLDFLNTLVPHLAYPPLPRQPIVSHGSLATVHSLLVASDLPAAQQWIGAHAEEVLSAFERHLRTSGSGSDVIEGLVAMLCWVMEWMPLWDERVLDSVGRLIGVSVGWEWRLPLLINVFASPYARPLIGQLPIDKLQPAPVTSASSALSQSLQPAAPLVLYAQLLFNLSLHLTHPVYPLPPALLSALLALLSSPGSDTATADERELVHRLVVQSLLLCVVERGRDVRVGCMAMGLCSGLEPIVARKVENASAFAALLLRVVRL